MKATLARGRNRPACGMRSAREKICIFSPWLIVVGKKPPHAHLAAMRRIRLRVNELSLERPELYYFDAPLDVAPDERLVPFPGILRPPFRVEEAVTFSRGRFTFAE